MKRGFFEAIATLVGTIIGAGVLAIPYAVSKAGFLTGFANMIVLSIAVIILYLYLGEVVLKTKGKYQLTGYAKKYLGARGKALMTFSMCFAIYGALIAYIIGVGRSLAALFSSPQLIFGISSNLFFSLIFFVFASTIVFLGLRVVEKFELFLATITVVVIILICIFALTGFEASRLASFDASKIFVPYGVILFALAGSVAIPEMEKEVGRNKKILKSAIIIGAMTPIILYIVFSAVTIASCHEVSEVATICLGERFGIFMSLLGNLFAILAMSTSFLILGVGLKHMYNDDYKIRRNVSWALSCLVPLALFFLIFFFVREEIFFKTISIAGGIAMTIEGILLVLIFNRSKKLGDRKPEYELKKSFFVSALLIVIFLLGMIYTIMHFFGIL